MEKLKIMKKEIMKEGDLVLFRNKPHIIVHDFGDGNVNLKPLDSIFYVHNVPKSCLIAIPKT